ncbi:hypothetical protein VTN02DRAFT_4062 [Thermoascus thermophilus]
MFPSSRTPEGLTPDSLGSSSVACRLGCLLPNQRGDTPRFLALPLPIARQLEPAGNPQRRSPAPLTLAQPVYAVPDPLARLPSAFPPPSCPCFSSGPAGRALAAAFE